MEGCRRRARVLASALLAVLTAALLATGCAGRGSEEVSREQLEQRIANVREQVDSAHDELGRARSRDEIAVVLVGATETLRDSADDLQEGDPPADAEEETDQLANGLRELAVVLQEASEEVEDGDPRGIVERVREEGFESLADIEDALRSLRKKGYPLETVES